MSQSGKVITAKTAKTKPVKRRRIFRAVLIVVVVLFMAALLAWINRYALLERRAKKVFKEAGITAELDIEKITKTEALLKNVRLSADGKEFLRVAEIALAYEAKKALKGEFSLMYITDAIIHVTLDKNGKIIDGWVPQSSTGGGGFKLPSEDISFGAKIIWQAPFGHGEQYVHGSNLQRGVWNIFFGSEKGAFSEVIIDGRPVKLTYKGSVLKEPNEDKIKINLDIENQPFAFQDINIGNAHTVLGINLYPEKDSRDMDVKISGRGTFTKILTDTLSAQNGEYNVTYDGRYNLDTKKISNNKAVWTLSSETNSVHDEALRSRLSRQVLSYPALSAAPITHNFSDFFLSKADDLMKEFSLEGSGKARWDAQGYRIELTKPLHLRNARQAFHITPLSGAGVLNYDKAGNEIKLHADLDWAGQRALKLTGFDMTARSFDGIRIDGIKQVKTDVRSLTTWRNIEAEQSFTMAPFRMGMTYINAVDERNLRLRGNLNYSGDLPGGRVKTLRAQGDMDIELVENGFVVGFTPRAPVRIDRFTASSGWHGEDLSFTVGNAIPLFTKTGNVRRIDARLSKVQGQLINPENDKHLDMHIAHVNAQANIAASPVMWKIRAQDTQIASEDFPSPDTRITSKDADLKIVQYVENADENPMRFELSSPVTSIETRNFNTENIHIAMAGVAADYTIDFQTDQIAFEGADIPVLPLTGQARLADRKLTGEAVTHLPHSEATPITMNFDALDGVGSAHISIPKIVFDPKGLQPQSLVKSLRGKLADVRGEVAAEFDFSFAGGTPLISSGTTTLTDLDVGTLAGPFSGVNAQLAFNSIFPLKTDGLQTVSLKGFDPGFPLKNGVIDFEIAPGGIKIEKALWPVKGAISNGAIEKSQGSISIAPVFWKFGNVKNRLSVDVENVSLQAMLAGFSKDKFSITGQVSGTLPAVIEGVNVQIDKGNLSVVDGGIIRFKNPGTDAAAGQNENAGYAFKALENLKYKQLTAFIDGPLDGNILLKMVLEGQNDEVLNGQQFLFNVQFEGELANIVRNIKSSLDSQENLMRILELTAE
jgi:hypothetical protein